MHLHSEILLSHKTEKIIILAAACMDWEIFILREVSQREKDKYCKILQTVGIYKHFYKTEKNSQIEKTKLRLSKES